MDVWEICTVRVTFWHRNRPACANESALLSTSCQEFAFGGRPLRRPWGRTGGRGKGGCGGKGGIRGTSEGPWAGPRQEKPRSWPGYGEIRRFRKGNHSVSESIAFRADIPRFFGSGFFWPFFFALQAGIGVSQSFHSFSSCRTSRTARFAPDGLCLPSP